jgi:hypothetical protein
MLIQGFPVYCAGGSIRYGSNIITPKLCETCELLCRPISAMYLKPAWRIRERGIMYNHATKSCPLYKQKENERK